MNCEDYEQLIYTYRELSDEERSKVKQHVATCKKCQELLHEVESFSQTVKTINRENLNVTPSAQLVNKVLNAIRSDHEVKTRSYDLFSFSTIRYSLAAVSCGILVLFFAEILVPDFRSGKIKGPLTAVQGVIIKSDDFRKALTKPNERSSLFDGCKNILSQQVDANCVREKLDKINF